MHTNIPQPAPLAPEIAEALARYDALTADERQRVARLVMTTGAPLGLAVSAVEALRRQLDAGRPVAN